jgi:hypothetical protein
MLLLFQYVKAMQLRVLESWAVLVPPTLLKARLVYRFDADAIYVMAIGGHYDRCLRRGRRERGAYVLRHSGR